MAKKQKGMLIMNKMLIALISGIIVGILCIFIRESLSEHGNTVVWEWINRLFFQDITQENGFYSIGIFYIIGQIFMRALQLAIVPLVLSSLSLVMCSMSDPKRLGKIAGKTLGIFVTFYVSAAVLAGTFAFYVRSKGWFSVDLPVANTGSVTTMEAYNPLVTIIDAVPSNITSVLSSNNSILAVVVVAVILGISINYLGEKAKSLKDLLNCISNIVQVYMDFLINRISPVAIFCMIARTFATYGIEYVKPTFAYMITTGFIGLLLVFTIYPIGIFLSTGLSPKKFIKKIMKVGIFAAATNSSAATLPLNRQTCIEELGCSEEISSFVLPTGMTINMNGTTVMHMMAITFIATAARVEVTIPMLITAAFLSICAAIGTPAIPVAGTTMIFVIMSGLGLTSDLCMTGYALVLAMNYLPGMAVITLNVVGDAATNVIISAKEKQLDKEVYYS